MTKQRVRRAVMFIVVAMIASLGLVFGVSTPAQAGVMPSGWHEPVSPLPSVSAYFLEGCGSGDYSETLYHLGIDLDTPNVPILTEVRAIGSGSVIRKDPNWPGEAIFIRHTAGDGSQFVAVYGHLRNTSASVGQNVTPGQKIGEVFDDHLHFGVAPGATAPIKGGQGVCNTDWPNTFGWVDPMPYLNAHPANGSSSGNLLQIENTGSGWAAYNLTAAAGNVPIKGTPGILWGAGGPNIFAAGADGALRQFTLCPGGGWCTYVLTGTNAVTHVDVVHTGTAIEVFAASADGSLLQIENNGSGWAVYNITAVAGNIRIKGAPSVLWSSGNLSVYAIDEYGALRQFVRCGQVWCTYPITGANVFAGGVDVTLTSTAIEVFAPSVGNHLYQIEKVGSSPWAVYDVTNYTVGNVEVKGAPGILWTSGGPNVFVSDATGRLRQFNLCGGSWCAHPITGPNALRGGVDVLHTGSAIEVVALSV